MTMRLTRPRLAVAAGLLLTGSVVIADGSRFSDFAPLPASAGPTADEAADHLRQPRLPAALDCGPRDRAGTPAIPTLATGT